MLFAATFAFVTGVLAADHGGERRVDVVIVGSLTVAAIAVHFVLPLVPRDLGLDLAILFCAALVGYTAASVDVAEGQYLTGVCLPWFGVFAAYYRPRRRFLVHLVLLVAAYAIGVAVNPLMISAVDVILVSAVLCGVSLMVSAMAEQLRRLALHDGLTGVLNRRGLDVTAGPLAASAHRAHQPVTVGMIDLDDFKGFNDLHGHLAGDERLIQVATAWQAELRESDLIARFGGDEFTLVLPNTTQADADELVARLRERHDAPWSVGFSTWSRTEDLYDALGRADADLFLSKRSTPRIPKQAAAPADGRVAGAAPEGGSMAPAPGTQPHS
jgi:diguanylate cyclase (GGDEF)-like protein